MIKLSKQIDYALQILLALARQGKGEPVSLKRIAENHHASFLFLQKIARQLRAAGLITATRGKEGGYCLAQPASRITTRQVVRAIEGTAGVSACTRPGEACSKSHHCTLKPGLERLNARLMALLDNTTIAELR